MSNKITWKFSPSIIEQYFGKNHCEKGMLVAGMDISDRKKLGWFPDNMGNNPAAAAGAKWEDEVLDILSFKHISCSVKSTDTGKWSEEETIQLLQSLQNNAKKGFFDKEYLYQINLNINQQFIKNHMPYLEEGIKADENGTLYEEESFRIKFSNCYPDLIRAQWDDDSQKWILSVVDCKLSKKPKLEHKIQVGLYTWILAEKINEWKQKNLLEDIFVVNFQHAYIWNKGKEEETEFELKEVYPFLEDFIINTLCGILDKIRSADDLKDLNGLLKYSIGQKCEWCDNFSCCKKWCAQNEPMVLVPYMSRYAQNFLRDISKNQNVDVLQIDAFRNFFSVPTNLNMLRQNIFWKRFINDMNDSLDMLKLVIPNLNWHHNELRQRKSASLEMPSFEKVQLVITAQKDEAIDRIYTYGIRTMVWEDCLFVTNLKKYIEESNILEEAEGVIEIKYTEDLCADLPAPTKGKTSNITIMITANERQTRSFDMAEDAFILILHAILSNVNDYNKGVKWNESISLQAYVMDNYELKNIEEMFYAALENKKATSMKSKICDLLFWIQGDALVESEIEDRPDKTVSFPVVILTSVLNKLYVFPTVVANSLSGVASCLHEGTYATEANYKAINDKYFVNRISNVLRNECINRYWDDKNEDELEKLEEHIKQRLEIESKIISAIRSPQNNPVCHENFKLAKTYLRGFRFVDKSDNGNSLIGQLEFEAKYESLCQFVQKRRIRGMDIEQAIREGKIIEAKCTSARKRLLLGKNGKAKVDKNNNWIYEYLCQYEVLNHKEVFDEDKFSCIFCEKNDKNIAAIRTVIDVEKKVYPNNSCVVKKGAEVSMPKMQSLVIKRQNGNIVMSAAFAEPRDENANLLPWVPAATGKTYLIFDYASDFNTQKNIDAIKQNSAVSNSSRFVKFLDKIECFYSATGENYAADKSRIDALAKMDGHTFSQSQELAMKQLYEKNITLLLGPPGTGKTDFISRALVVLCEIYKQKNRQLRVLVSANSHSAIENVLFAVEKKAKGTSLKICKAERFDDGTEADKGGIEIIKEKDLQKIMNANLADSTVVGATVWTTHKWLCSKSSRELPKYNFDVVVLDEASQVRLIDSIIPFTYSDNSTRFLIVGDENQLSPIILGSYDKEIEEPFKFGSVFRYLSDYSFYHQKKTNSAILDYQKTLTENFRMNEILVRYSEQEIYKSGYSSFGGLNSPIATQKLNYNVQPKDYLSKLVSSTIENNMIDTLDTILDEEYPLVLCMVNGDSQVKILEKEIKWITRITRVLQNCIKTTDQKSFWGSSTDEGVFGIIAPHHEHISRIKDDLASGSPNGFDAPWGIEDRAALYVGTVDKLQGKEREAVIVSYGVGDIEQAMGEGEFIYSRNRLNVALTRGKKKVIVFLTKELLDFPIEALAIDNKEILEGINYICGFKKFMTTEERDTCIDKTTFESNIDNTSITVFRKKLK